MFRNISAVFVALVAFSCSGIAGAQTMPNKWDQKCLDDAGKMYIKCMASTGTNESAKEQCKKDMNNEKKQCKKK